MSFHLSSENLRVEQHDGKTFLVGRVRRADGSENDARLCLDDFLGNDDGRFQWDGMNFTESSQNCSFSIEGGGAVPVLRAELRNAEGNYQGADINLAERIENINGDLIFQ